MSLTRIDSAFLDLDALGGIDFDVQSGVPTLKVDATNHRVGIGHNSPTEKLDVVGNVNISSGSNYLVNGSQISTANIAEHGSYQYFTNARAISAVTGSALNMGSNNITTTGKILFANMYSTEGDLPSASTYHGMFAHVHGTEKAYFAHGGNWIKLLDENGGSIGSLNIDGNASSTTQFSGFDALRIHNANGSAFGITADMYFTVGTATANRGAAIGVQYATTTGNDLYFATNPGSVTNSNTLEERLRITSDGKVGIGIDSPLFKLQVNHADEDGILLKTANTAASFINFSDGDDNDIGQISYDHDTNHLAFRVNADERLRITSAGELVSTNGTLRRNVSDSSFTVSGDSASNTGANINLYGASHSSLANVFRVRTGSTERLRVTSTGLVKINTPSMVAGTNAASALLQIKSVGQYDGLVLGNTYAQGAIGTNSQGALIYTSNAAPANLGGGDVVIQQWYSGSSGGGGPNLLMNLTTGGNLGLGCTPGNSAGYRTLQLGDGSNSAGQIWIKNSANANYYNWFDGTGVNFFTQSASPLVFYTNQKEKLRVRDSTSTTFANNPYVLNITGYSAYDSANYMAGSGMAFIGEYNSSNSITTFGLISGVKENTTDGDYGGSLIFGVRTNNTGAVNQEKARISSTGNMGIGHTNPSAGLHIKKQGRDFGLHYFYDGYNSDTGLGGSASSVVGSQAGERTHSLILESTSTADEDVGASIGFRARSSSGSTLGDVTFGAIVGAKENSTVTDDNGYDTQSKGYLAFYTSNGYHFNPHYGTKNNERMRISSDGDVGIGLTNPVHRLQVAGGIKGDYLETNAHAIWTQSVETGTGGESGGIILKTNPDLTSSNMSGAFIYRVRAVVKGTGTDTGATWLVYYKEAAAQYVVRFVSRSGTSSNHPRLRIANTTQMELYTTHNSNYAIRVITERFYTDEPDSTLHAMGGDYHWQRDGTTLSYTDGNIVTNYLTPNPLNLTASNGWVRSSYGGISNSTVSSLNNLLIGQNMRGYLSGRDGSSVNNNFYHIVTHGSMGYNGTEYCFDGKIKFFAGTGGTTADSSFTPSVRFQIQSTLASFSNGTTLSQGDSEAFHNGMRSYSNRGYVAGNGTVSCTLDVANSQTTYLVIAGFNHYGLLNYGATYMAFAATGPSGPTSNVINNQGTSLGGTWSISQGGQSQIVVSKSAGTYNGGGYWFVHIMAAS